MRWTAIAVAMLLAGCTRAPEIANSWVGRHVDELVMAWGPPQGSHVFADLRRVISYGHQSQVSGFNPYAPYQTALYECRALFTVDQQGIIVASEVAGNIGGCNGLVRGKPEFR